jgi:hypothetical protein
MQSHQGNQEGCDAEQELLWRQLATRWGTQALDSIVLGIRGQIGLQERFPRHNKVRTDNTDNRSKGFFQKCKQV